MNEPKPARTSVDTERVIRDLLDAFKSLKTATTPPNCLPGREEEQRHILAQSRNDPAKEFALVGADPSEVSAVPGIAVKEREQVSRFERTGNLETFDDQIEAQSGQYGIIEAFCRDHGTIERLHVSREELQALADTSLLGTLTCKQDVLFILRQTRAARSASKMQATVRSEPVVESGKDIELSDFRWWAEHIRRESAARLDESYSSTDIDRLNPLNRPFVLSLVVVLMTTAIAIGIEMC